MNIFQTNTMNLIRNGNPIAYDLPMLLTPVSVDIILNSQGTIPTDSYNAHCVGYTGVPVPPQRGDYLVDTQTGATYQVFGNPRIYTDHFNARVTKYLGNTP